MLPYDALAETRGRFANPDLQQAGALRRGRGALLQREAGTGHAPISSPALTSCLGASPPLTCLAGVPPLSSPTFHLPVKARTIAGSPRTLV